MRNLIAADRATEGCGVRLAATSWRLAALCAKTASTPSIASTALVSLDRIRPCANIAALEREVLHACDLYVVAVGAASLGQA